MKKGFHFGFYDLTLSTPHHKAMDLTDRFAIESSRMVAFTASHGTKKFTSEKLTKMFNSQKNSYFAKQKKKKFYQLLIGLGQENKKA